ncbi:MAG: hypothetical protein GY906_30275 [bacterium]|nr:hypothetical protein [bacterium]
MSQKWKDLFKVVAIALGASTVFLVAIPLLGQFIVEHAANPAVRWLVATPGIALAAVAVFAMRNVRRMDELEQKIHYEAMAFAFLCSVLLITSSGYLAVADLPTPPLYFFSPIMVSCWVVGLLLAVKRYR